MLSDSEFSVASLDKDTQLEIVRVVQSSNGSYGRFLRVIAKVISGPKSGIELDIPACVPYHPRPRWISICTQDSNKLVFESDLVRQCSARSN